MSFAWFRKHEKWFLWAAVAFSVLIFILFSGLGDLQALIEGRPGRERTAGQFVVADGAEVVHVSLRDFARARSTLNRLRGRDAGGVDEEEVWAHLIALAEAEAAQIDVSDEEVSSALIGMFTSAWGRAPTREEYTDFWRNRLQFASARQLEEFYRDQMRANRWQQLALEAATIVDADDVFLRWRGDRELFDIEAIVVPDLSDDQLGDPGDEALRAWFDALPAATREGRFAEPERYDIVYAWLPADAPDEELPEGALAGVPEPAPSDVETRFRASQAEDPPRWPDLTAPGEAERAQLARELRVIALAQQAQQAFEAAAAAADPHAGHDHGEEGAEDAEDAAGAGRDAATFAEAMRAAGFRVEDPAEPLGPAEIEALPIGDRMLPLWLGTKQAGQTHATPTFGGSPTAFVILVEDVVPSRPRSFEEARTEVLEAWRDEQRGRPAQALRDELRRRTRELPEVAESLEPLLEAARARAEEAAGAEGLDEAGGEAARQAVLDEAEAFEIRQRLSVDEHRAWADLPLPEGARRIELQGVPRSYASSRDGPEAADSIERFLKTNGVVFRLGVDGISEPLRHVGSDSTAIVRVTGRRFPPREAMDADPEGFEQARRQLVTQRRNDAWSRFSPEALAASHDLQIAAPEAPPEQ